MWGGGASSSDANAMISLSDLAGKNSIFSVDTQTMNAMALLFFTLFVLYFHLFCSYFLHFSRTNQSLS